MTEALGRSFASLQIPNFRRYFTGQLVSLSGNWMQTIAEMWLILSLTGSGLAVGFTTALQFLPMLIFGAWGGLIADRVPEAASSPAHAGAAHDRAADDARPRPRGSACPWMVFGLVFLRGCVNAVDYPTRQAFVMEMVGSDRVVNAVSLNSVLVHSARVIGPAFAGVLIATVGVEPCFALNAASFAFMIWVLAGMDTEQLRPAEIAEREPGAVRAGLRYVRREPELWIPLGTDGDRGDPRLQLPVRPAAARRLHLPRRSLDLRGARGRDGARRDRRRADQRRARLGHPDAAGRRRARLRDALAAGRGRARPSRSRSLALAPLGAATVTLAASINSSLQLASEPTMRGRVMALYSIVFLGSTPIGGPLSGWLSEAVDPRAALVMGGHRRDRRRPVRPGRLRPGRPDPGRRDAAPGLALAASRASPT